MSKPKQHFCNNPYFKNNGYMLAIEDCIEDGEGRLAVSNGEYVGDVDYCPFCGFKAKTPARKYNE